MESLDTFSTKKSIIIDKKKYYYFNLEKFFNEIGLDSKKIPFSVKILIENILRNANLNQINLSKFKNFLKKNNNNGNNFEIPFYPTRVLMQDFTGVPALVDLAAMRDAVNKKKLDPNLINPIIPVDLVIDHSVSVDHYGDKSAFKNNVKNEFLRNKERYEFLKWGQNSFNNFNVVPPGTGICHQVNLEYLAKTVWVKKVNKINYVFPDSLLGTDSHTTMVNALSVLGWGVGGIEAEAAILGEPIIMNFPKVVGVELNGKLKEGITATDLVLTVTEKLRAKGVVGKFVEFFGEGLNSITLADRATISNMAPEYGATCGFFPIDQETLNYLKLTGRSNHHIKLVRQYAKIQGLWVHTSKPNYDEIININLNMITPSLAGPKRPQDRIELKEVPQSFHDFSKEKKINNKNDYKILQNGSVVIAAITSCTNTSNPNVLIAAGLLAKKALANGLTAKPWVKTSFAPGSQVVSKYLDDSRLSENLNELGFNVVGYGCTTCIGNSGPLEKKISDKINLEKLTVCSVLSGNRNFEGRVHPEVKANYLASPPLVVAYSLAGNVNIDITRDHIGFCNNKKIYLRDLWPTSQEIQNIINKNLNKKIFISKYKNVNLGDSNWKKIKIKKNPLFKWNITSSYVKHPPYFDRKVSMVKKDIINARILAMLGNTITTDHISPAGTIMRDGPAGTYLSEMQIPYSKFNSFGSRRGNHEVMIRGTFGNIRLKNELVSGVNGGVTRNYLKNINQTIFKAAIEYKKSNTELIIIAGKEYGTGSSRDWAAKGTSLLGVRAVIAESYERIHRSNLIGMGVIPFEFIDNQNRINLKLNGEEIITIKNISDVEVGKIFKCLIKYKKKSKLINLLCRIDTKKELEYYKSGGILNYLLEKTVEYNS